MSVPLRHVFFLLLIAAGPVPAQETFLVTSASGEAQVGKNKENYAAVKLKSPYPLGFWAKTASASSLVVTFSPENIFRLLPSSEVQISGSGAASATFRRVLQLKAGSVDLSLDKLPKGSKVDVETPTAICGAVGTHFAVNAETGEFDVPKGRIYARAKDDSIFAAKSAGGSFTLAPGPENAFSEADVSGSFVLDGKAYSGDGIHLRAAKASGGTGTAAVAVTEGSLDGQSGALIMQDGKLGPVVSELASTHAEYLSAAAKEGQINLRKQTLVSSGQAVPRQLETDLRAAAARATELRNKLFVRGVMRDVARETVRQMTRPQPRP